MNEVTNEGKRLIERWRLAKKDVQSYKSHLNSAECEEANAERELGKWLVPHDAHIGEKFCVWMGDSLFTATKKENGDIKVEVRTRGKHHSENFHGL